ncbi:hypothetical protein C799_02655 [Bacteroides thetaiotaomicron dnLKV9]|jgi:hypothetical protein|uniref:Uncharacterized protein n=1 Tax=Bacteroides thetaiotaomicron dnLKV9 TaxID=1235785 RepID=R9HA67_BACT4|nr:hypothetical protein [Bacteroides thetaiotaomicron]EOS00804.1 hypothetical protein C799_02655 [Bacteroides thetaiotaomicron dnLKV9]MCS2953386.1 hypothetical protein [Bacteroides thetaiotaomicron]
MEKTFYQVGGCALLSFSLLLYCNASYVSATAISCERKKYDYCVQQCADRRGMILLRAVGKVIGDHYDKMLAALILLL